MTAKSIAGSLAESMGGNLNSFVNRGAARYATKRSCALNNVSSFLDSRLQRQVLPFVFISFVAAKIAHLHGVRCPSAIFRLVVAVIVDAINRMFGRWTRPHVVKEVHEVGLPAVANNYSSTAPSPEQLAGWVVTPFEHSKPRFVLWGSGSAVSSEKHPSVVDCKATARLAVPASQVVSANLPNVSAVTNALPGGLRSLVWRSTNYSPPMEALTAKVFHFCHAYLVNPNAKQIAIAGDYSR